jgi:ATP:corrinoid adenosyltransferase
MTDHTIVDLLFVSSCGISIVIIAFLAFRYAQASEQLANEIKHSEELSHQMEKFISENAAARERCADIAKELDGMKALCKSGHYSSVNSSYIIKDNSIV